MKERKNIFPALRLFFFRRCLAGRGIKVDSYCSWLGTFFTFFLKQNHFFHYTMFLVIFIFRLPKILRRFKLYFTSDIRANLLF